MFKKLILMGLLLLPSSVFAEKAGIGAWENPDYTMLRWIEQTPALGWYYNWRPNQIYSETAQSRSVEFVPMIHNADDVDKRINSDLRVTSLLGFNEPDSNHSSGSGISVEQAIALWPKLEARGLRLGSPATLQSGTLGANSWQRRFMTEVERRGLRVDFMAVHYYYKTGNVREFEQWLNAVHNEYKRPIWVTEFAYIDWTRPSAASYAQNAAFAEQAILMMERLPFVERHAWFAANPYDSFGSAKINLVNNDLSPTPVGVAFDRVISRIATQQVASN